MIFGAIYKYLTGANEVSVPVRQAEPIDDWELIEDESTTKVDEPIKVKESSAKVQRRKNTKKISKFFALIGRKLCLISLLITLLVGNTTLLVMLILVLQSEFFLIYVFG